MTELTAQKTKVLKQIINRRISKSKGARELNVSRKTIYIWLRQYKDAFKSVNTTHKRKKRADYSQDVLKIALANPQFGPQKISKKLSEKNKRISAKSVWLVLCDLGLSNKQAREDFSFNLRHALQAKDTEFPAYLRLNSQARKRMVEDVLLMGKKVKDIILEYKVSRKTFAKWKKRYQEALSTNKNLLNSLSDQHPVGTDHPNGANQETEKAVLDIVIENPRFSSHKIAQILPQIGNHGAQNILKRNDLNTFEKRSAYAERLAESSSTLPMPIFDRIRSVWEKFIASRAPAPPPMFHDLLARLFSRLRIQKLRRAGPPISVKFNSLLRPFFLSLFCSILFCLPLFYWVAMISQAPSLSAKIGLFFATISLLVGGFFFIYSMKYYATLAIVLSFSRHSLEDNMEDKGDMGDKFNWGGWLGRIFGVEISGGGFSANFFNSFSLFKRKQKPSFAGGLQPSLEKIKLERYPFVSIHLPMYNEKKVAERLIKACASMKYFAKGTTKPNFEILVCDDSTDETTTIIDRFVNKWNDQISSTKLQINPNVQNSKPIIKVLRRPTRQGFKGAALANALKHMDKRTEFVAVFDADFVPYPDTLELFVKYFKTNNNNSEKYGKSKVAVVGGYQWHVLNKSENWITRGVRSEYAGSYVVERPGGEIMGLLKQISGSVYMIRADILQKIGWGTSITEDFQLTLKLYEQGYKVVYTPYVQAPAECVSTLKRLIRQRMRWAEGHSHNIRKMFWRLLAGRWEKEEVSNIPKVSEVSKVSNVSGVSGVSKADSGNSKTFIPSPLTFLEKLEFLYLTPYYLQAAFFLVGTFCWLISETVFKARLPFWTSLWGWSLVLTNFFALPLVNAVGLFLEESEEKDYLGLLSFVFLSYILVPFQAYASIKGFLQKEEGPWFRTPKSGKITDIFTRGQFYRWIQGILPGWKGSSITASLRAPDFKGLGELGRDGRLGSPYLALASAHNRFNHFRIRRKTIRSLSLGLLIVLLAVSSTLVYLTPTISAFQPEEPLAGAFVTGKNGKFYHPTVNLDNSHAPQIESQVKTAKSAEYGPADEKGNRERRDKRNRTSKTFQKADGTFVWEGSLGPIHYQDSQGNWQEIDTNLVPSSKNIPGFGKPAYQMTENDYELYIKDQLTDDEPVLEYLGKNTDYWVRFTPRDLSWTNDKGQKSLISKSSRIKTEVQGNSAKWPKAYGEEIDLRFVAGTGTMQKWLDISSPLKDPPQDIINGGKPMIEFSEVLDFHPDLEVWINGQKWDKNKEIVAKTTEVEFRSPNGQVQFIFPVAVGFDKEGNRVTGQIYFREQKGKLYVSVQFPWDWLKDAVYPVYLDTTVDKTVAAGADDGYNYTGTGGFDSTDDTGIIGYYSGATWLNADIYLRWTGVSIEGTIDASYIQIYSVPTPSGTPLLKVYGVDEDNPAAPTTAAEFNADPLTTAGVDWDGVWTVDAYATSPSLNTIFQELVNSYTIANDAVMVQVKNDGGAVNGFNSMSFYEEVPSNPAKLHIEYNSTPNTPTLDSPADTATAVSTTPDLKTTTTDPDSDALRYKIQIDTVNTFDSGDLQTFDQTASQTGWSGQDADLSTAYASGTQATYTVQSALSEGITYYWRSYAIDYAGSNTWSGTQSPPYSFTTVPEWSLAFVLLAAFLPKKFRRRERKK